VFELKTSYAPSAVAAGKSINIVAIGEVGVVIQHWSALHTDEFLIQDKKVRLHEWDGKALKEIAALTGNRGVVSALAFSPNGSLLSAGDVGVFFFTAR
jgi:WD repeat-containing protein 1 (actin-interacting protein 1)